MRAYVREHECRLVAALPLSLLRLNSLRLDLVAALPLSLLRLNSLRLDLVAVLLPRAALAEGVLTRVGHPDARERVGLRADEARRAAALQEGGKRVAARLGHEVLLVGVCSLPLRAVVPGAG